MITQTALELGFLYALVAMALFLSFRILNIADMTTDGCFVLGAAVSVTLAAGGHPILAIPAAMLAGSCAGFVTAFLQTRLGIPSILAGIVTNTGLYTVNLMAMGWKANQSLLKQDTIFTLFRATGIGGDWNPILLSGGITVLAGVLPPLQEQGVYLAAQCCEHLNRALIVEEECAEKYGLEMVNVKPQLKAGGSFSTAAWNEFEHPCAVEYIQAHAGIDIGDTLIGMHLRHVAVPVRTTIKSIGSAHVVCARTRLKYIGGERAAYQK